MSSSLEEVGTNVKLNVTTVLVALTTLAAFALYRSVKKPANFPPGPTPLPFLGNVGSFMSKKSVLEVFEDNRKKYGDVFSLRFASMDVVILNGIDVIKEAMLKKAVEFAGRPQPYSGEILTEGFKDIIFSSGSQWRYQRKLAHTAVRHFTRKEQLENLVFTVTPQIATFLDDLGDEPFAPKRTLGQIVYNILSTLCFGKQYEFNNPELMKFINLNTELMEVFGNGLLGDLFPIFRYIKTPQEKRLRKVVDNLRDIYYTEFKAHMETFDPENNRDFFDALILTQKEAIAAGEEEAHSLTDTHLVQTVGDVFGAGTGTTTLSLHWSVALMAEFPDIQEKVALEIDDVIGRERMPSLDDMGGKLPFTEATILEVFRYGSVSPFGVPHSVQQDTTLCGYDIPKGTMVMINHVGLHYDPNEWDQPKEFKPERFLNENGQLPPKLPESFLPFGCGRRICLGEDFAKKEIFLLFTWLFCRYTFYKVPGKEDESLLKLTDISGFVHQPYDNIEVCVKRRF